MPNYKLIYFVGRGRAEIIRILFEVAGVKYKDVRINERDPKEWPNLKPKMPFGQLPVLEIDGKAIGQGRAIYRYLAREFGLYGSNNQEALDMDIVIELCDDLFVPMCDIYDVTDAGNEEQKLKEMTRKYYNETAPKLLGCLEKVLCQNKGGSGFFVGDKLSIADIVFVPLTDFIEFAAPSEDHDTLAAFPKLKAYDKRLRSVDRIADWIKRRPVTVY